MPPRLRTLLAVTGPPFLRSVVPLILLLALGLPARAGSVAIINGATGSTEPEVTARNTANLDALLREAGNTTTIFDSVPADLSSFDQVWDIRWSNNFALTPSQQTQYLDFLTAGRGMFVMGEHSSYMTRNDSVFSLIAAAGGGNLTFQQPASTQNVVPPFDGPNSIPDGNVTYAAPGGVSSAGNGQFITVDGSGWGTGVAFAEGQLVNAPSGILTAIFDVNFMEGTYDQPDSQQLLRNLISFIANAELTPEFALNPVGTEHTLTATLRGEEREPLVGVLVTFSVISGPNAGDQGTDTTDENGKAQFTYLGDGGSGVDRIVAAFDDQTEETVESNIARKFWDEDCNENDIPDTCDLSCGGFGGACSEFAECGTSEDLDENGIPDECAPPVGQPEISLSPARAHLDPGVEHTLTASLFNASAEPLAGVQVDFEVVAGQNAGEVGSAATDDNGEASFTYSGAGEPGWDLVVARATVFERDLESSQALVLWGSGIYAVSDWAEAFDHWTYQDNEGVEHTIGFLAARSAGVQVLDVTNPLDVQSLGSYQPGSCETDGATTEFLAGEVTFVEQQQALHIAAGACGVHIVSVAGARNPDDSNRPQAFEPQLLAVYDRHVKYSSAWVEALAVRAGMAYVADYDALRIFDVSNVSDIQERGSLGISRADGGPVGSVVIYEDSRHERLLALVATGDGMRVVNVNDPDNPYVIVNGSYQHDRDLEPNAISQDIAMGTAPYEVLLPAWVGGLSVVYIGNTLSDEGEPEEVDTLSTDVAYYTAVPYQGRIYATEGIEGLRALYVNDGFLDTVDSLDPIEVGSPGADWAWDVVVAGSASDNCVAYVTFGNLDTGAGGLQLTPLPLEACQDPNELQPQGGQTDEDLDGVADAQDNCLQVPNADQTDSDLDGFGNACDADYNDDGGVNAQDLFILSAAYGARASDERYDAKIDLNSDGFINLQDLLVFSNQWGQPPGPSGLACAGSVPCP